MGTFSGGGFGGGSSGDAFSQSGSSGAFGNHHHHHHHHRDNDNFYPNSYGDTYYYNNQQPYRESPSSRGEVGCGQCCSIFLSFFTFFGSLWMLFGVFKSDQAEMKLNYSRVITANSVFVKQIQIRNLRDPGPVVYSFNKWPALSESVDYTEYHESVVEANTHQEWGFWLNQGSSIHLSYEVRGLAQDYLVLAFIRGREGLEDWTRAPETPAKALKWYRIHGKGVKSFVASRDGEYYVALGNLNRQDMEGDVDIWEVVIVYTARWATYIVIWGIIVVAIVVLCAVEAGGFCIWPRSREELPLLAPQDDQALPNPATIYSPGFPASNLDAQGDRVLDDHQLCTVCLDAPKDCFFDPCGHRCTCYSCGRRIQRGDSSMCPICRQPIRTVRKIFDS